MSVKCDVYKTSVREHLYLYVYHGAGLDGVPEALLAQFREPELALTFDLHPERNMAREDPKKVLANLEEVGYHLQLPPVDP